MPPAALTLSSHIFQTTTCFLASSASGPVSASGAPILITSAALAAHTDTAIMAAAAAMIWKYRLDLNNITALRSLLAMRYVGATLPTSHPNLRRRETQRHARTPNDNMML